MKKNDNLAHRKAQCKLYIVDEQGMPVANTKLTFRQTRHEFLFGCGAFNAIPLTNPTVGEDREFLRERMDRWLALYNYGTLPFYLGQFEAQEGKPETESRMRAAEFLREKNVTVKGHPLCWHTACADWLMKYDNKTILEKQLQRIVRDVTDFKGTVDIWDVINEVVIMPIFDKYDNAITRVCKDIGRVGIIKETFAAAKEANPKAQLLLNDFNTSISYEILIDGCLQAGVPISAIGIQSHQHQGYWGLKSLSRFWSAMSISDFRFILRKILLSRAT